MSLSLPIPESVLKQLLQAAEAEGTTPTEWIQSRLPKTRTSATPDEIAAANSRLSRHIVDLGFATGTDNDQIDADLAEEYGATHDPVPPSTRER